MKTAIPSNILACSTLVELLQYRAHTEPDRILYRFLQDGEREESSLTYAQLDVRARKIGRLLQEQGATGERVLLIYQPGLEYISAFFGCLYAGSVAVPIYPPSSSRLLPRLQAVTVDSAAKFALSTAQWTEKISEDYDKAPQLSQLTWLSTDELREGSEAEWHSPGGDRDTLAFLQYTSGSTSLPKGVMVSHGNLLHNSWLIQNSFGTTTEDCGVIWLPPYHDMGLIGGLLQPLYAGFPMVCMEPLDFMQRPMRWLEAISRYKATISGGPNFSFELVADKVTPQELADLDLSSWRVAFNGAEPIRAEGLRKFAETFAVSGFQEEAFLPCYGLAEATLLVSGKLPSMVLGKRRFDTDALELNQVTPVEQGADDQNARLLVSSGQAFEQKVIIVDPATLTECAPDGVGEVWVKGSSVAKGYWNNPEKTAETFHASLADTGEGPFLRTGDLGFLHDGELFITGRVKDLIIIRGRNHYPQDIEFTVETSHVALRPGAGAAFSVTADGEERLVVVQEVERRYRNGDLAEPIHAIRQAVAEEHGVQVYAVVLVQFGSIPKTSSGKIQRHACRNGFLENSLNVLSSEVLEEQDLSELEVVILSPDLLASLSHEERRAQIKKYLLHELARELHLSLAQIEQAPSLGTLGIDSLLAFQLQHKLKTDLGVVLPVVVFLQERDLNDLVELLADESDKGEQEQAVETMPVVGDHRLSLGQRALWFLQKLAPDSTAYHIARAVKLKGDQDADQLKQMFQTLIDRHAALRTTFPESAADHQPVQRVHAEAEAIVERIDATGWSEAELRKRLNEEANAPFDLERGPLMRVQLFKSSPQEHVLLWTFHHIIVDLWSLDVLVSELGFLLQGHDPSQLPAPQIQMTDYVRWQNALLDSAEGERKLANWLEVLSGELPILNLPTDYPRPAIQTYSGAAKTFQISRDLTQRLKDLSKLHGATLYATLLAAYGVLLHRYTGQADLMIGSPLAARTRPEMSGMVGYVTNAMPLRLNLEQQPDFARLLEQVSQQVLGAFANQEVPFDAVLERLAIPRDPSRSPVFQTTFVMQNIGANNKMLAPFALGIEGAGVQLGNFYAESVGLMESGAQFDLSMVAAEHDGELGLTVKYNNDLFEEATIERLLHHFGILLEGIASTPQQSVALLPLLSEAERRQLLVEWNETEVSYPQHQALHQLFEEQAAKTPDAAAVIFEGVQLTYRELNSRANRLGRALQRAGVTADTLVGIAMDRSVEMVVSLLAILKAGGAYVPIDPAYPQQRIAYMLEDANVSVLLMQQHLIADLPQHEAHVFCVDADWERFEREDDTNVESGAGLDTLAYMIYTSGSTGQPKGAKITHRGICNRLLWMQEMYQLTGDDRVMQKTPFSFDVSVWEFFWPLITGACLVVAKPEGHKDSRYLLDLIREHAVTTMHFVPSMLQVFLEEPNLESATSLRQVMCSGEALHNLYGPTEASVDVTYWECRPDSPLTIVPIGRPISNTQLYVLDEHLQPVPVGVAGELHIGGIGLARGYHNRPELTAEKFISDPFSKQSGARLYKTGDLVRYLSDGNIEYLGRIDHQVKVRGFRIELGEIETAILQHPAVRETVVVAQADGVGDKRLVAYLVAEEGQAMPSIEEWRSYLRERLPDYMMPSIFMALDQFPLSPNGKLDRKALPTPSQGRPELETVYVAPRNRAEQVLAGIWSEVLVLERVGIYDNFFSLGGDSIKSISIISKSRNEGLHFTVQQVFQYPTIAGLAEKLEHEGGQADVFVPSEPFGTLSEADRLLVPEGVEDAYPLTILQEGLVYHTEMRPGTSIYHDIMTYRIQGAFSPEHFARAVHQVVHRHPMLRTTLSMSRFSCPMQLVHKEVEPPLFMEDLRSLPEAERVQKVQAFIQKERAKIFNWNTDLLVRYFVHVLTDNSFQFSLSYHDTTLDGWSVNSTISELFDTYLALVNGEPVPERLPLTVPFRDFVIREQKSLTEGVDKQYWERVLSDCTKTHVPRLASNLTEESVKIEIQYLTVPVSKELSDRLKNLAAAIEVPLKSVLLSAHARVLTVISGQHEILTGYEHNGRLEVEGGDRTLGLFLNTVPFRLKLEREHTWIDLIRQTYQAELDFMPHRWYPLPQMQQDQGGEPLFETVFNFTHFHVAGGLVNRMEITLLDQDAVLETEFALRAEFNRDVKTDDVNLYLHYDGQVLTDEQAKAIGGYYLRAMELMTQQPDARSAQQSLLSEEERTQMLVDWNNTNVDYPLDRPFHALFDEQAEQTPDAVAVSLNGKSMTYGELRDRSNQLANHLQTLGVQKEAFVGYYGERCLEWVVSILAIFKAGGVYVPLDPTYPRDRLAYMMEDAELQLMLTVDQYAGDLSDSGVKIVRVDGDWQRIAAESTEPPARAVRPDDLAYVIYTSGSTGKPKGALIEHIGMLNHLYFMRDEMRMTAKDIFAQTASHCVDISVGQVLAALLVGGRTHILKDDKVVDPLLLTAELENEQISLIELVPTQMRAIVEEVEHAGTDAIPLTSMRYLMPTGEALPPELARKWLTYYPHVALINAYGPTECSDDVTFYTLKEPPAESMVNMPIGKPIANYRMYVLDAMWQPVPVGVPGELYVGGFPVGRGYLNNPERTKQAFFADPFEGKEGARLYKTGDLVRYLPDGNIEFLGRIDHQVKIRGFRIELGEIEAVLFKHPGVRQVCVVAREDQKGDKCIVAYLVADQEQPLDVQELRAYVKQALTEHMVPSYFVMLDEFPLTLNGKIDRKKLPEPEFTGEPDRPYIEPATETEAKVAAIWAEVLAVEFVSMDDDFFERGGNSILGTRLISRLRRAFDMEIPLRVLFDATTVQAVAREIDRLMTEDELDDSELAALLDEVEGLSEEEIAALLKEDE